MARSRSTELPRRLLLLVSMVATAVAFLAPVAEAAPTVITVTKTASPAEGTPVTAGSTITYSIQITSGAADATGVELTDATPANTTYVDGSATINTVPIGGGNPFADGEAIPTIPAGQSATATFQVTVNSPLPNGTTLTNTATVTADEPDAGSDLSDDAAHTVASAPSLSVTKTSDPAETGTVNPGETINYTIVVQNLSSASDSATGVTVSDPTPANTEYVADSATVNTVTVTGASNPFENAYSLPDLDPGESHTVTFQVLVEKPLANNTAITNTATADAANSPAVSDGAAHVVTSAPGLTVDKSASPAAGGTIVPGEVITYTIVVTNDVLATETATGVRLMDPPPTYTTYVPNSALFDGMPIPGATDSFAGYTLPDMNPGDSHTLSFAVTVNRPLDNGISITNNVTVRSDQTPGTISDQVSHTVQSNPKLTFVKTSAPSEGGKVTAGTTITYTITVTNAADATEKGGDLELLDPIPTNTSYVAGSAKLNGTPITGNYPFGAAFELPDLAPGTSNTVTFDVQVANPLPHGTVISNIARLTANNHAAIEDSATHTVDATAVLRGLAGSDPKPGAKVQEGDVIQYTLYVENDPRATTSLPDVVVTAETPDGTSYVDGSAKVDGSAPSGPSAADTSMAAPGGGNPFAKGYSLGTMAPGDSHRLSYRVMVQAAAGTITNTLQVQVGNEVATTTIRHRGPGGDGGGEGGGGTETGGETVAPPPETVTGGSESELAFTGLDLMRLLLLAITLLLAGGALLARARALQRRVAAGPTDEPMPSTGSATVDRWVDTFFYPQKK
jgi:uncharacterized repeat protein (TIGR01451 family)